MRYQYLRLCEGRGGARQAPSSFPSSSSSSRPQACSRCYDVERRRLCTSMSCLRAERQDDIASYLFSVDSFTSLPLTSDIVPGKAKSNNERCPPDVYCAAAYGHSVQKKKSRVDAADCERAVTDDSAREKENARTPEYENRQNGSTGEHHRAGERQKRERRERLSGREAATGRGRLVPDFSPAAADPANSKSVRRPRRDVASAGISRVACILHKRLSRHRCFVLVCGVRKVFEAATA